MPTHDPFEDVARYYNPIMAHVDYDRWFTTVTALAEALPSDFIHLDAACGTGTLMRKLQRAGWRTLGIDLSPAMIQNGLKSGFRPTAAAADLCHLPFKESVDYITCLFDSLNFLLDQESVCRALSQMSDALRPDGLLYFDIVTERMITEHFEGEPWTEDHGRFTSTWHTTYCRQTTTAETSIRFNTGAACTIRERIYPREEIEEAVRQAGLELLGTFDADNWGKPSRKTVRIDFFAAKTRSHGAIRRLRAAVEELPRL